MIHIQSYTWCERCEPAPFWSKLSGFADVAILNIEKSTYVDSSALAMMPWA